MAGQNSLNQASTALIIGPIGASGTLDQTNRLLQVRKDQSGQATIIQVNNVNSGGFASLTAGADQPGATGLGCGIYQYGSAAQDSNYAPTNGASILFSNTASTAMYLTCENGSMFLGTANGTTTLTNQVTLNPTTGGTYRGIQTNTAPGAGFLGQLLTATATTGALTSNTITNVVTGYSLTAGNWDISAYLEFSTTGTVAGNIAWSGAISLANNNLTGIGEQGRSNGGGMAPVNGVNSVCIQVGPTRASLSGTTNVFLNCLGFASVTFTNVTCTGVIRAVRVG